MWKQWWIENFAWIWTFVVFGGGSAILALKAYHLFP